MSHRNRTIDHPLMRSGMVASASGRWVGDLLWPPTCPLCLERGAWVCDRCRTATPAMPEGRCLRCDRSDCVCDDVPDSITLIRSVGSHEGWLAASVRAVKYGGERARAIHLGALMTPLLEEIVEGEPDAIVVPVPLHRSRQRERGFNQAAALARAALGQDRSRFRDRALRRVRPTRQQVGLSAADRAGNVTGAFQADAAMIQARPVILVDDVYTTGSTVAACAAVLIGAGASAVAVLTVSRARFATHGGEPDNGLAALDQV